MQLEEKLSSIELTPDEKAKIKEDLDKNFTRTSYRYYRGYAGFVESFTTLYKMRYYLELPVKDMADYFNVGNRAIEHRLDKAGWAYNQQEAQQIAASKVRDYTKIKHTFKKTMIRQFAETHVKGSKQEEYIRQKLGILLTEALPGAEVVVGINNLSVLHGYEVDIPVIIIKDGRIHRYAVEASGTYWHNQVERNIKSDIKKKKLAEEYGYELYTIWIINTKSDERIQYGTVDEQIDSFIQKVQNDIHKLRA
jgi:hypothetical protein